MAIVALMRIVQIHWQISIHPASVKMKVIKIGFQISAKNILLTVSVLALMMFIMLFPIEALEAAGGSVQLWFNRVLPSLLPFMIGINILSAIGFTELTGKWLTHFMKIFGVPGEGGFALAAGMGSGYPMGAKVTAELREKGLLTRIEAQRLISFTNNSGPLFILGTVGIGMFNSKHIGYFLMLTHYIAALITGLIFRYYKKSMGAHTDNDQFVSFIKVHSVERDEPLGKVLSQSVMNAMDSMVLIGGFIVFFGVICNCLMLIPFFGNHTAIATGILEMTNGLYLTQNSGLPLKIQVLTATALISFGGLSIHAQTISMIGKTDINSSVYLLSKILHAIIAVGIGLLLYPLL